MIPVAFVSIQGHPGGVDDVVRRHQAHYINGRLSLRVPPSAGLEAQWLRVLGTDVVLLRQTTSVRVSLLEPSAGDTMMLGTPRGLLKVRAGSESILLNEGRPAAVLQSHVQVEAASPSDILVAAVSRSEVRQIGISLEGDLESIKFFDVDPLLFLPFIDTVLGIFNRNRGKSVLLDPHHSTLLHLMGAGVLRERSPSAGCTDETLIMRARTLIMQTHRDPQTTPKSVALRLGVSLRTLQRAFSAEGTLVGDEIRHARAIAAQHFLQHEDRSRGRVSRAAKNAGFKSVASMHRALDALTEQALASSAGPVPPHRTETAQSS